MQQHKFPALLWSLIALFTALLVTGGMMPVWVVSAQNPYPHHAGLVIRFGDGSVYTRCVDLGEDGQATGEEVLRAAGDLTIVADYSYGLGAAVCKINHEGCNFPAEHCFCKCMMSNPDEPCVYWSYWHWIDGQWQYSQLGASSYTVRAGAVEGWQWGAGTTMSAMQPPAIPFDAICVPPTVTPTPTSTRTPTSTPTPMPMPTPTPTPTPTPMPTPAPTSTPAPAPTAASAPPGQTPLPSQTFPPTAIPSQTDTPAPGATGGALPTEMPNTSPSPTPFSPAATATSSPADRSPSAQLATPSPAPASEIAEAADAKSPATVLMMPIVFAAGQPAPAAPARSDVTAATVGPTPASEVEATDTVANDMPQQAMPTRTVTIVDNRVATEPAIARVAPSATPTALATAAQPPLNSAGNTVAYVVFGGLIAALGVAWLVITRRGRA